MAAPTVGKVRIASKDPPLGVTALLGADRPDVTSGYGGWNEVQRPWRKPITTFVAPTALHMTLSLMLDGFANNRSVEDDVSQLEAMASSDPGARDGAPPRVKVSATGSAVPHTDRTWVVGELSWGDAEMNRDGDRIRQAVTLTLYEYVEDVYLTEKSAAKRMLNAKKVPKTKSGAHVKRITVKVGKHKTTTGVHLLSTSTSAVMGDGEDLLTIAARELGDADRWVEIAELNGIRDPRSITTGQAIRLP